ncbi:MAG: TIM44-like domain-containing protein [Bacilli bacterium]|nr:TIM44-like domain-containing protein [Bacilli bacterium]
MIYLVNIYEANSNRKVKEQKILDENDATGQQMISCIMNRNFVGLMQMLGLTARKDFDVYSLADEREQKQFQRGTLDRVDEVSIINMAYQLINNKDSKIAKSIYYGVVSDSDLSNLDTLIERKDQLDLEKFLRLSVDAQSIRANWFLTKTDEDKVDESLEPFFGGTLGRPEFKNAVSLAYILSENPNCILSQAIKTATREEMPCSDFNEAYNSIRFVDPSDIEKAYDNLLGKEEPAVPATSTNINDFDSTLDNGMFYTKVDNIYVMLYTALMFNDLSRVDHKVSDEVMQKYTPQVEDCKAKNQRHMYGQLNVKSTNIDKIHLDDEGNILAEVTLVGRYLDYIIDLSNGKKISGDDQERVERTYKLVLKKSKDAKALSESRHCPNCGEPADLANTGKCVACNTIFPLDAYDYILQSIVMIS